MSSGISEEQAITKLSFSENGASSTSEKRHHTQAWRQPRKRVITEQRRAQNRQAQKAYRENQKHRLQKLTSLVASYQREQLDSTNEQNVAEVHDASMKGVTSAFGTQSRPFSLPTGIQYDRIQSGITIPFVDHAATPPSPHTTMHYPPFPGTKGQCPSRLGLDVASFNIQDPISSYGEQPSTLDTSNGGNTNLNEIHNNGPFIIQSIGDESLALPQKCSHSVQQDRDSDVDSICRTIIWRGFPLDDIIRAGINSLERSTLNSPRTPDKHGPRIGYHTRQTDCNSTSFDSTNSSIHRLRQLHSQEYRLPDPLSNCLRINQLSLLAACLANASLLGVAPDRAIVPNCESPFFSTNLEAQHINDIQSTFSYIKPDLRPCATQITTSHCIYIDVIPFPTFRERIIALRSTSPPILDEMALMTDIDNDGLICWGSRASTGSGAPWDMRSWEAQPWFLRKWWMLTGEVDSQMSSQSRWWREMRGEMAEELQ